LNLDLSSNEAKIDIKKGKPHVYFKDESYASLSIKDSKGNTVYTKDFIGDKVNEALVKNIPIKIGYYITIKHQEPKNRLLITNLDNKLELEKGNSITYKITDGGVEKVPEDEIIKVPKNEWNANKSYNAGDKVDYKGKTYEAKWWSHGFAPDTKVQNSWETPWKLIS
ncbi:MAG: putative mucin/carbohydrate-binding domain-containing protein, partial [Clostridium botulinum]|nr:putative mucin/carbohydrate-binding domain-containing protein [Clostridium botulinum]